jgi:hypothetical protein
MGGREYKESITLEKGSEKVSLDPENMTDTEYLVRTGDQITTAPAPSGTVPSGTTTGDLLVWDGAAWVLLPAGDDGDALISNGPGTLPSYQTISAPKSGDTVTASLEYIGQGETGPTKTTTVFDGATIAEQFVQIGDTLYTNWLLADNLDNTQDALLRVHFYLSDDADPIAPGTAVSFQIQVGASNGLPLNTIVGTITVQDEPVAGTWLDAHAEFTLDAATYLQFANQDALNFRLTRVNNSVAPEPSDGPRVHLIELDYIAA